MTELDASTVASIYMEALNLVDALRNEVYALQDSGQAVEDLIDTLFELEEELLRRSE